MAYERKREGTFIFNGMCLPINEDDKYKCIPVILETMAEQLFLSLSHHSKVMVMHVQLTAFEYCENNNQVRWLLKKLKQWLNRQYRMHNIGHIWVRESDLKKKLHWHLVIMLNGNQTQHPHRINKKIKELWEYRDIGLASYPRKKSYHTFLRTDADAIKEAFYHMSYLAKERSKGLKGLNACDYGASKLKSKKINSAL